MDGYRIYDKMVNLIFRSKENVKEKTLLCERKKKTKEINFVRVFCNENLEPM